MSEKVFRVLYRCDNCYYEYFQEYEKGVVVPSCHQLSGCPICDIGPRAIQWREPMLRGKENLTDNLDNIVPLLENKGCGHKCTLE